ncbi:hypothetical protein [Pengzhenrongella sicca]|uniref:Uncharacterized protein n=1 Tax=Pengzhenrongella sicca TaxID=2819238 RepID=A0A8A4Z9G8_9MICO|nr:hypothetical protein [Pengzhenrongella sicca]QTE28560.1 hypothetical protein J4E96_14470 [Pengzhenrongella sicca]
MIATHMAAAAALDSRTDWISLALSGLTLLAAIAAGLFAGRAAHWTK